MVHRLTSFQEPLRAVVIGASGGIGRAFCHQLLEEEGLEQLYGFGRKLPDIPHVKCKAGQLDYANESSIEAAAAMCESPNLVIVATGLLHDGDAVQPEKQLRDLQAEKFAANFLVNTTGPALVAKHFLPLLPRDSRGVFATLSARVGSISDNRMGGWYAYRSAKAALNMVLKCAAIEIARKHKQAVVVGLHPGTVDTALSKPFQGNVKPAALFKPSHSASCLLGVLNERVPAESGKCYDWDGKEVPA